MPRAWPLDSRPPSSSAGQRPRRAAERLARRIPPELRRIPPLAPLTRDAETRVALFSAKTALPPRTPPAIWAQFAQQAAWKDWVIAALLTLNGLLIIAGSRLAHREPDVVVIGAD